MAAPWFRRLLHKAQIFSLILQVWIQRRFTGLARQIDPNDLKGWMPAFIRRESSLVFQLLRGQPQVLDGYIRGGHLVWLNLNGMRLTAPWLFGNFLRAKHTAVTDIDFLTKIQKNKNSIPPTGFIFHIGRCGSTLLKNMLAGIPENLVLSEPEIINQVLFAHDEPLRADWLRGAVNALGQAYTGLEKHYFIKFTSICVARMNFIRQVFPDVRMVFLYRNPVEVINSVMDGGARWMVLKRSYPEVAEKITGIKSNLVSRLDPEEYAARVIGCLYNNVLKEADENVLLVNYNRLSEEDCLNSIISFFGMQMSDLQIDHMLKALKFYSKDSRKKYRPDTARKSQATQKIRDMAKMWAQDAYEGLESIAKQPLQKNL